MQEHPDREQVDRVQVKLQAFYDALSEDDRAVMEDILRNAAQGDGAALLPEESAGSDDLAWLLEPPSFLALDLHLPGDVETTRIGIPVWPSA